MSSPNKRAASEELTKEELWEGVNLDDITDEQTAQAQAESKEDPDGSATPDQKQASQTAELPKKVKKQRRSKNSPEPDYSQMVQNQMSSTNRTGQACDRCKGRKMKCDSNPAGCANCSAINIPCTQTDPITRESHTRGEIIRLRREVAQLRAENEQLRRRLHDCQTEQYINSMYGEGRAEGATMGMGGIANFPQQGQQLQLSQAGTAAYPLSDNMYGTTAMGQRTNDGAAAPTPYGSIGRGSLLLPPLSQPHGQDPLNPPPLIPSVPIITGFNALNNAGPSSSNAGHLLPSMTAQQSPAQMMPGFNPHGFQATDLPRQQTQSHMLDLHQRNRRQLQQLQAQQAAHQQALQAQAQSSHSYTSGYTQQDETYPGEPTDQLEDEERYADDVFQFVRGP